ncbi:MAG: menA, partial [Ignavibacteria bacterium]|nr:menA [Ignavibacteria bacterium]
PVLLGGAFAFRYYSGPVPWYLFPLVFFCGLFLHAGANLVSEYDDFKYNVDREETFGGSRVLVESLMKPKTVYLFALMFFVLAFLVGIPAIQERGLPLFYFGLVGISSSLLYTSKPLGLKYIALGDLLIFISFGPNMALGTSFALTGVINTNLIIASIPVGFLVTAILHANNTRDIMHDKEAHIHTFAGIIGVKGSQFYHYGLILGAYLSVIIFVATGLLAYPTLIVLLTLPIAIGNMKQMAKAKLEEPKNIFMLDVQTAQLHMLFGLTYTLGIFVSKWLS